MNLKATIEITIIIASSDCNYLIKYCIDFVRREENYKFLPICIYTDYIIAKKINILILYLY